MALRNTDSLASLREMHFPQPDPIQLAKTFRSETQYVTHGRKSDTNAEERLTGPTKVGRRP